MLSIYTGSESVISKPTNVDSEKHDTVVINLPLSPWAIRFMKMFISIPDYFLTNIIY